MLANVVDTNGVDADADADADAWRLATVQNSLPPIND